ncbi:Di-copper centre-containing protein [Russula ochroleuca]|uniref:Di-copper centre-containing protein n=1 Tax=Russula ochroleuca TaxID=152965 RepID=A0A9P5JZK4_9AGAM|nr:Di-copper centre-containing protein [Russula ochroleuca]
MSFYKLLSVSLAFLWSVMAVSCSCEKCYCTKPAIRREWRAFTTEEKAEWIRAINLPHDPVLSPSVDPSLSLIPPVNTSSSYFDDIVYLHMDQNIRVLLSESYRYHLKLKVHFSRYISPENSFPGIGDAPDFYESLFWKDSDPVSGLGGWGDPNADFRVPDGGFHKLPLSYPSPHTVRRNFTLRSFDQPIPSPLVTDKLKMSNTSFTASVIEAILRSPAGDFKGFQKVLEAIEGPHSSVHGIVAGDMVGGCPENAPSNCKPGPSWSPNDRYYARRQMVDKIWYDWQSRDPVNVNSFFGGSVQSLESLDAYNQYPNGGPPFLSLDSIMTADGLFPEATIGDVMNTTGGYLCYVYE